MELALRLKHRTIPLGAFLHPHGVGIASQVEGASALFALVAYWKYPVFGFGPNQKIRI
jgi:hypothetical protein